MTLKDNLSLYGLVSAHSNLDSAWVVEPPGIQITYSEFFDAVDRSYHKMSAFLNPSDIVAIDLGKSISTIVLLFTCIRLRLGFCFLDRDITLEKKEAILRLIQPNVVFSDRDYCRIGYQSATWDKISSENVIFGKNKFSGGIVVERGGELFPKGITESALAHYIESSASVLSKTDGAWLSAAPLHSGTFPFDLLVQFARGLDVVVAESRLLTPDQMMTIIGEEKITELAADPDTAQLLKDVRPEASGRNFAVRKIYYHGEALSYAALESVAHIFPRADCCHLHGAPEAMALLQKTPHRQLISTD